MATIFSKIISGEIPCYKIAESDKFLAFLDISPIAEGHVLVVPKQEIDYVFDLDDDILSDMLPFAKKVAMGIKKIISCNRIGIAVIGLEVPHAHMHLIPLQDNGTIDFTAKKLSFDSEMMASLAKEISEAV